MSERYIVNGGGARAPAPPTTPSQSNLREAEKGNRHDGDIWNSGMGQYPLSSEEIERLKRQEQALRQEHDEAVYMENKIRGIERPQSNRAQEPSHQQAKADLSGFSQEEIEEALQSALKDLYSSPNEEEQPEKGPQYGRATRQSARRRSKSPTRSRSSAADEGDGTVIRSPMYRPASPSRRKRQDGVIMTSWSQAPRFKDEKTWIPGPGKYNPSNSTFEPTQVPANEDFNGLFGHTWGEYQKRQHHSPKKLEEGDQSVKAIEDAPSKGEELNAPSKGELNEREREYRRENVALRRKLSEYRLEANQRENQLRSDVEHLRRDNERKSSQLEVLQSRVQACKSGVQKVQGAVQSLNTVLDAKANEINRRILGEIRSRVNLVSERATDVVESVIPNQHTETEGFTGYNPMEAPRSFGRDQSNSQAFGTASYDLSQGQEEEIPARRGASQDVQGSAVASFAKKAKRASMAVQARERASKNLESRAADLRARFGGGAERVEWTERESAKPHNFSNYHFVAPSEATTKSHPTTTTTSRRRTSTSPKRSTPQNDNFTVDEKLRKIYEYYSYSPDDRLMDTQGLRSSQFFKILRDGGVLDNKVTYADADVIFTRISSRTRGGLISYEQFVDALTEIAMRKYRDDVDSPDQGRPHNLRRLLKRHIMPLFESISRFPGDEGLLDREGFTNEFLQESTLDWFNEHGQALQFLFSKYAMHAGPHGQRDQALARKDWSAVQEALSHMSEKQCLQFAQDYCIVPTLLRRPQAVSLYREAARMSENEDVQKNGLSFPFFVEFLAMVAYYVFSDDSEGSARSHLLPTQEGIGKDMTAKLEMLFWTMHEHGASFREPEENKLLKKVQRSIKDRLANLQRSAEADTQNEDQYQYSRVHHILMEKSL
eukprot:gb/GECG01007529.1/.p1 GENE.gb/GECG01007529.1/~~gb/GECG01007529.1/.p1  ORF type:complete len:888 (+),score=133.59 gb/GECG01007529.1/:1-2664(+)